MNDPKIKTKVVHSQSKDAWNIVGTQLGKKYKIARVPYILTDRLETNDRDKNEALEHAEFISACFNNSELIIPFIK